MEFQEWAQVGRKAPEFDVEALVEGDITRLKLSDYQGKWVILFFYPGDFTFVCPTELVAVAKRYSEFQALGVEILGISVDSPYVHLAWQRNELSKMVPKGLPYPMLTDRAGNLGRRYGVYDEMAGTDLRGMFVIDPAGVLQAAQVLAGPLSRDVDELLRLVQGAQYIYAHPEEALTACWHPGAATLKPGADLVGKVWESQPSSEGK